MAEALERRIDDLEARIEMLRASEELAAIRPDMDGAEVMAQLGVPPGPIVGRALEHLLELRLDLGPMTHEDAAEALACWWADQPESAIVVADREK